MQQVGAQIAVTSTKDEGDQIVVTSTNDEGDQIAVTSTKEEGGHIHFNFLTVSIKFYCCKNRFALELGA